MEIEQVEKVALWIVLVSDYEDYAALEIIGFSILDVQRRGLCDKKFTKNHEKFFVTPASTDRPARSAIPYMQRLL